MSILLALAAAAASPTTGSITVHVGNVRNSRGRVVVDICPQNRFLEDDCPYHGEAFARAGSTTVTVANVPAGNYAAQAFHDENDSGEIDRGMFGIPNEGVGFSRNARIRLSPPKWKDAWFVHQGRAEVIRFDMRYFTGAKGPGRR
ncbi:MAG: DUF2141 domain-containing protein [Novosphingobium sp.]